TELHRSRLGLLLYPNGQVNKPAATGSKPGAPNLPPRPRKAQVGKPQFGRRLAERQHTPLQHRKHEAAPTGALGHMLTPVGTPVPPPFTESPFAEAPTAAPPAPKAPAPRAPAAKPPAARPPVKAPAPRAPAPAPKPAPAPSPGA